MAISALTIASIELITTDPATLIPPSPWNVAGVVTFDAGTIDSMAFQIDDGPVTSFAPPTGAPPAQNYDFNLTDTDLPANGLYLLTVYAWDSATDSRTAIKQINMTSMIVTTTTINNPAECCP